MNKVKKLLFEYNWMQEENDSEEGVTAEEMEEWRKREEIERKEREAREAEETKKRRQAERAERERLEKEKERKEKDGKDEKKRERSSTSSSSRRSSSSKKSKSRRKSGWDVADQALLQGAQVAQGAPVVPVAPVPEPKAEVKPPTPIPLVPPLVPVARVPSFDARAVQPPPEPVTPAHNMHNLHQVHQPALHAGSQFPNSNFGNQVSTQGQYPNQERMHMAHGQQQMHQPMQHMQQAMPHMQQPMHHMQPQAQPQMQQPMQQPMQHMQQSMQHMQQPMQHMQQAMPHMQQPMQHMQQPMQHMQQPMQHMQQPIQHMQQPMQQMHQPMQHMQQMIPNQIPHAMQGNQGSTWQADWFPGEVQVSQFLGDLAPSWSPEREERYIGRIKRYQDGPMGGYGFIDCDEIKTRFSRDVYIHKNQMVGFQIGDEVSFTIALNNKGEPQARNVMKRDEALMLRGGVGEALEVNPNLMDEHQARQFQASLRWEPEKRTTTTFHEPNLALKHWNVWKLTCSKLFAKDVILSYLVISRHILSCCFFFSSSAPQPCWAQWRQRRTDCPFLEGNPTGED